MDMSSLGSHNGGRKLVAAVLVCALALSLLASFVWVPAAYAEKTVTPSIVDQAPQAAGKGQSNVVMARLVFTASGFGGSDFADITGITITVTGTPGALSALRLVKDANNNGWIDGGELVIAEKPAPVGSTNDFTIGSDVLRLTSTTTTQTVLVVVDVKSDATVGTSFAVQLAAEDGWTLTDVGGIGVTKGAASYPLSSSVSVVQPVGAGSLLVSKIVYSAPANALKGQTSVNMTGFTLYAAAYDVVWSGIKVKVTTQTSNVKDQILAVKIVDAAGNVLASKEPTASATTEELSFTISPSITVVAGATPLKYFIFVDIRTTATPDEWFNVQIESGAKVTATSNNWAIVAAGAYPIASTNTSIRASGTLTYDEVAPDYAPSDVVVNQLFNSTGVALTASGEAIDITSMKIRITVSAGTPADVVSLVEVRDSAGNVLGSTTTIGSGGTTDTAQVTFSPAVRVEAGTTKKLFFFLKINSTATVGGTVQAGLNSGDSGFIVATGVGTGVALVPGTTLVGTDFMGGTSTIREKGTLSVSIPNTYAAAKVVAGATNVNATRFKITATYEDVTITSLKLKFTLGGASNIADIFPTGGVRLYRSTSTTDADGSPDLAAGYIPATVTASTSTTLTLGLLSPGVTVPAGKSVYIHVVVDIKSTITDGWTFKVGHDEIAGTGAASGLPISFITDVDPTNEYTLKAVGDLTLEQTGTQPPAATISVGTTTVNATLWQLTPCKTGWKGGAGEGVIVKSIKLTLTGTADFDNDIAAVRLFTDSTTKPGNLGVEIPTTVFERTTTAITLNITGGLTIAQGTPYKFHVVFDLKPTARAGKTVIIGVATTTDVYAVGTVTNKPVTRAGAYSSNTFTIKGALAVSGVSLAPTYVTRGSSVALLKLTFTAISEPITVGTIRVSYTGTLTTDAPTVSIYLDHPTLGVVGGYDTNDLLLGSGTFDPFVKKTPVIDIIDINLLAGESKTVFLVVSVSSTATSGNKVGVSIADAADISATGGTTGVSITPTLTAATSTLSTIQIQPTFDYLAGTLSPTWVEANATNIQFTLKLTKGGEVALILNNATLTWIAGGYTHRTYLSAPIPVAAGSVAEVTLTFKPIDIQNVPHGASAAPTLRLTGVDANGASFTQDAFTTSFENIRVDNVRPSITHTPVTTATLGTEIPIVATVTDANSGVSVVKLNYRITGAATYTTAYMTAIGANTYRATIPATAVTATGLEYYVEATDLAGNTQTTPTYTITVPVPDTTPPTITHTPVTTAAVNTPVTIRATVTDNVAVQSVTLYYRTVGAPAFTSLAMVAEGNVYSATIPATAVTTAGVEYYIVATDTSNNQARAPTTGTYTIQVTPFTAPASPPTRVHPVTGAPLPAQVSAGSSVGASTTVTNLAAQERTVRIFFVVEKEGVPLLYGSATVRLAAAQSFDAMQGWILVEPGTYTVRITVTDATTGVSLSEEQTVTYTVVG